MPVMTTHTLTGRSKQTIVDWFNMCREVCSSIMEKRPQMIGTEDNPVQIDESYFSGKRKNNTGCLLQGNLPAERDRTISVANNRNHGNRVSGPWVFGLYQGNNCRYFWVERRDADTLIPLIEKVVAPGSVIHSDEWGAYNSLNDRGFIHTTVTHKNNFVDPATGCHTQGIERSWLDAKVKILKRMRHVPRSTFQSHLDYYCWTRFYRNCNDLLAAFMQAIRIVYN